MQENKSQNAILIIERLKTILNYSSDSDLYNALNIKQSTLSAWKNRGIGDYDIVITFCNKMNLDLNFILSGKNDNSSYTIAPQKSKGVPLLPIDAFAGLGLGEFVITEGDIEEYYYVPDFKSADFLIPVKGSSMQPKYNGGDILACKHIKEWSFFQWGVPHLFHIKGRGVLVKRPYKGSTEDNIELRSDNFEKYPPFEIHKSDIINLSIVIGVIRLE